MYGMQKLILFFEFVENYYVSKNVYKNSLNMVKKRKKNSKVVIENKYVVWSSHPPLETVIINPQWVEVKASPLKIPIVDPNVSPIFFL